MMLNISEKSNGSKSKEPDKKQSFFDQIYQKTVLLIGIIVLSVAIIAIIAASYTFQDLIQLIYTPTDLELEDDIIPLDTKKEILTNYFIRNFTIKLVQYLFVAIIIIVPLTFFIYYFLLKRFTTPLSQIITTIKQHRKSYPQKLKIIELKSPTREIEEIKEAYNELIEKIKTLEKTRQQLISDLGHELKTPITKVLLKIQAMKDGVDKFNIENLEYLRKEIGHLNYLITQLQTLSEISQSKEKFKKVNLKKIIEEVLKTYPINPKVKYINKVPEKIYIKTKIHKFKQLVDNIISNAIKHTDKGYIKVGCQIEKDRKCILFIKDTGEGIPKNNLPFIFKRFYTVKSRIQHADVRKNSSHMPSVLLKENSLGLGLAIVKEIVESLGFKIFVKSKVGKGTVFYIDITNALHS